LGTPLWDWSNPSDCELRGHIDRLAAVSMDAMKLAVGILLVVLAAKTCPLAMAQDVEQPPEASFRPTGPSEPGVLLAGANEENDNCPRPDDGLDACCRPVCNDPCPCFYGQVEALFIMRDPRFTRQRIVVDPNTGTTYLSTSDLEPNFNPGLRATIGMRLCGGRVLEFSYFGLFQGNASAVAVKPEPDAFLTFVDNLAGNVFVDMDRVSLRYSSSLQSFAVNLPCCCGCCDECGDECGCGEVRCRSVTWFGGFRYINLGERLNISAQRTVSGAVEEGAYNIRTANNLYGAQLGARLRRTRGRLGWETTGAAGIFGNDAQQTQSVTDFPNFPLRPTVSSSRGGVAFVGEINFSGLYRLTDVWNLRAGYSAILIEGLALAPDQLDFNFAASPSGNQLHSGGGLLLHGVNVGLEARW
jgi:hypothetical protein